MTDPPTVSLPEEFPLSAFGLLLVLTCAAIAVHGYHLGIEDEAIYLPAIKKLLDPQLYPYDAEFFLGQARGSALPLLVAYSVRATHVPLNWAVFGWQFASLYLMLLACFCVVRRCFAALRDQWGALTLVTALLTLPVAGTGLYLADQHLHPRTLATAAILYSLSAALDRRIVATAASAAAAFALHPLMAIFGISLVALIFLPMERWSSWARPSFAMPFLSRPTAAWREAVATREYYFLRNWQWYEWLGIFAPVVILWWFLGMAKRFHSPKFLLLAHRVVLFSILWFVAGMTITVPRALEFLVPIQPMRYLHLVYLLMILFAGGFLAGFGAGCCCFCPFAWECSSLSEIFFRRAVMSAGRSHGTRTSGSQRFCGFGATRRGMCISLSTPGTCRYPARKTMVFVHWQSVARSPTIPRMPR